MNVDDFRTILQECSRNQTLFWEKKSSERQGEFSATLQGMFQGLERAVSKVALATAQRTSTGAEPISPHHQAESSLTLVDKQTEELDHSQRSRVDACRVQATHPSQQEYPLAERPAAPSQCLNASTHVTTLVEDKNFCAQGAPEQAESTQNATPGRSHRPSDLRIFQVEKLPPTVTPGRSSNPRKLQSVEVQNATSTILETTPPRKPRPADGLKRPSAGATQIASTNTSICTPLQTPPDDVMPLSSSNVIGAKSGVGISLDGYIGGRKCTSFLDSGASLPLTSEQHLLLETPITGPAISPEAISGGTLGTFGTAEVLLKLNNSEHSQTFAAPSQCVPAILDTDSLTKTMCSLGFSELSPKTRGRKHPLSLPMKAHTSLQLTTSCEGNPSDQSAPFAKDSTKDKRLQKVSVVERICAKKLREPPITFKSTAPALQWLTKEVPEDLAKEKIARLRNLFLLQDDRKALWNSAGALSPKEGVMLRISQAKLAT